MPGSQLTERITTKPAVRESQLYPALTEFARDHAGTIEKMSRLSPVPPEALAKFNKDLSAALGVKEGAVAARMVWSDGNSGIALFRVTHPKDGEIGKIEFGAKGSKAESHLEVALSPDMLLKRGLKIGRDDIERVIFPPSVARENNTASDPKLGNIDAVYSALYADKQKQGSVTTVERAETAAFISRYLGIKLPNPETVKQAFDRVMETRERLKDVPLFKGRSILLAAHSETVLRDSKNTLSPDSAALAAENATRGRDEHRFGREYLQRSLKLLAGEKGGVTLVRPEPEGIQQADRVRNFVQVNRELFQDLNTNPKLLTELPEVAKSVRGALAQMLDLKDPEKLDWKFSPQKGQGEKDQGNFVITYDGKQTAWSGMRFDKDGQMTLADAYSYAHTPEEDRAEIAKARGEVLRNVRELPPGPDGFTMLFDGHGAGSLVGLNEGVPIQNKDGASIAFTDPITAEDLVKAIVARHEKFPAAEGKPDIYVFAACVSGSLITDIADRVKQAGVPVPVLFSQTEVNLLGASNSILPVGNEFIEDLLMPYEPAKPANPLEGVPEGTEIAAVGARKNPWDPAQVEKSPTIGDIVQYYTERPLGPNQSNPRIIAGLNGDDEGWIQIR